MTIQTMIVDDEPRVRKDIRNLLAAHTVSGSGNEIEVICEAGTIETAKELLLEHSLDLVFLDVRLRGGTGFDLVPYIDGSIDIIFITGYDEYAIRAFEVNALDYLMKPVNPARLAEALLRINEKKNRSTAEATASSPKILAEPLKPDDCVMIKQNSCRIFIHLNEIIAITAMGDNYTSLIIKDSKKLISRKTLKDWEACLPSSAFFRIHRSAIINTGFIRHVSDEKDGTCRLIQTGYDEAFTVSRRISGRFKKLINKVQL